MADQKQTAETETQRDPDHCPLCRRILMRFPGLELERNEITGHWCWPGQGEREGGLR